MSDKDGVYKILADGIKEVDLEIAKQASENPLSEIPPLSKGARGIFQKNVENPIPKNPPDPLLQRGNNKINIAIPSSPDSKTLLQKLSDLLKSVEKGNCEVYLSIPLPNGSFQKIKTSKNIFCDDGVAQKIGGVVGERNVKIS